ncbi:MAG: tetratricopeptide repeat protein [candidate division WOR-3 bacterium]|jgi:lipopolysaccharide biosynthesis regulator YciM
MYPLLIVIVALLIVALYPVIRDFIKQRKTATPSYVAGLQLLLDGKIEAAKMKLKAAVEEDTDNIDAYIRLGQIFLAQGDTERALIIHENLTLRRNLTREQERNVFLALVEDYLQTGRQIKAVPLLEEIVRQDKTDYHNCERLLNLYLETTAWEKAEKLLKEIPRTEPKRVARLYTRLGYCRGKQNPEAGIPYLHEAIKINPKSMPAYIYLGDLFLAQGKIDSAIEIWGKLLDFAPEKNYLVRERLERAYYESGRYDDIVTFYRKLLNRVPQDFGLALDIARIYAKKEEIVSAISLLDRYARSNEPSVLTALAALHLRKGNSEQAQKYLDLLFTASSRAFRCPRCHRVLEGTELYCAQCLSWVDDIE